LKNTAKINKFLKRAIISNSPPSQACPISLGHGLTFPNHDSADMYFLISRNNHNNKVTVGPRSRIRIGLKGLFWGDNSCLKFYFEIGFPITIQSKILTVILINESINTLLIHVFK
jgi:hypothetical protein